MSIPWTEKYRPNDLDDIVHQDDIIQLLKSSYNGKIIPHLLFHGPPGTGKTSSIIAICKQYYGNNYQNSVLELNASDDRGITIIRGKIKEFAKLCVNSTKGPKFKIIILDEADFLTADAQAALRRCIECYSNVTRFCIICNYINKIIIPIQSRCAIMYFKPIPHNIIKYRLEYIIKNEKIDIPSEYLYKIIHNSDGDLRKAINNIQFYTIINDKESYDTFYIDNKLNDISNLFKKTNNIKIISKQIKNYLYQGISGKILIKNILEFILDYKKISDTQKYKIIENLSETECNLIDGSSEYIQIINLLVNINYIIHSD